MKGIVHKDRTLSKQIKFVQNNYIILDKYSIILLGSLDILEQSCSVLVEVSKSPMTMYFFLIIWNFDNIFSKEKHIYMSFLGFYPQLYQIIIFVYKESLRCRSPYMIAILFKVYSKILAFILSDVNTYKATEARKPGNRDQPGVLVDTSLEVVKMNDN